MSNRSGGQPTAAVNHPGDRLTYGVERIGALSDGIFAVALTILVLELKVPEVPHGEMQVLRDDLIHMIPNAVAWIVSFALIARFWTVHHDILASLGRCTPMTIAANFVVLTFAALIPFATALIGTYEFHLVPVVVFSVVMSAVGAAIGVLSRHTGNLPVGLRGTNPSLGWH